MANPRESMANLPGFLQPFFTWLTGVPLANQAPDPSWGFTKTLLSSIGQILMGMFLGYVAMSQAVYFSIPLIIISGCLTAGGLRRIDIVLIHHMLHNMIFKKRIFNKIYTELFTVILIRSPYELYKKHHLGHHKNPCSQRDHDREYLLSTGMKPDFNKKQLVIYLIKTIFSPTHHAQFFWARIKNTIFAKQPLYRYLILIIYISILGWVVSIGYGVELFLLWFLPLVLFFQISSFLFTLSEHRWFANISSKENSKIIIFKICFGRFCGDPTPNKTAYWSWFQWWLRVLFIHIPNRIFILVGDTAQHDLHHMSPGHDWRNSRALRYKEKLQHQDKYTDVWGSMFSHIQNGVRGAE